VQLRDFSIRLICCGVYVLVSCRPAIPADLTLYNKLYICYGLWHGGRIWTCLQAGDTTNMTAFLCVQHGYGTVLLRCTLQLPRVSLYTCVDVNTVALPDSL
jgi:hypothetical protein